VAVRTERKGNVELWGVPSFTGRKRNQNKKMSVWEIDWK
jgi:hypothetical protein